MVTAAEHGSVAIIIINHVCIATRTVYLRVKAFITVIYKYVTQPPLQNMLQVVVD